MTSIDLALGMDQHCRTHSIGVKGMTVMSIIRGLSVDALYETRSIE